MTRKEKLLAFDRDIQATEQELRYCKQQTKITQSEIKRLTRKERTQQLCVRGGMLESYLREPELLSDDQVQALLNLAFRQEAVLLTLRRMLAAAKGAKQRTLPEG